MASIANNNVDYTNKNLTQASNTPSLLHLPKDVLQIITRNVADELSSMKSAIRAVEFERVCAYTHLLTHENDEMEALLEDEKKFAPLVKFLEMNLKQMPSDPDDFYRMRLVLEENDLDALKVKMTNLFEDYLSDHPGPGSREAAIDAYKAELKTFLDQEPNNNKKDLFKVFYAAFKRAANEVVRKDRSSRSSDVVYENCVENASKLIASEPAELSHFLQKVHAEMTEAYAQERLGQLTIGKYIDFSRKFLRLFVPSHPQFHELHLRQALQRNHDKSEFEWLSRRYAHPGLEIELIKENLRAIRSAELKNVKAEIRALCGDYFNGAIDAVYRRMVSAEANMHATKAEYFESIEGQVALLATTQDPNLIDAGHQRINARFQKHAAAMVEYKSLRKGFEKLNARLAKLAVWTNGVMTGGRKIELEAGLQEEKLTADAYLECQKISAFYALLSQPIDESNKDEAYELMHNLIGE